MIRTLVIEDEENVRLSIARSLAKEGHDVVEAATLEQARNALDRSDFDVLIVDINLGDADGVSVVEQARAEGSDAVVVVITAYGSIDSAVRAMKAGADEYLLKPLSLEELAVVVQRALERRRDRRRLAVYDRLQRVATTGAAAVAGVSDAWRQAVRMADRLAKLPLPQGDEPAPPPTVLIVGETGAGKNVLARRIHETASAGAAVEPPFVHVNCSALPAQLIESELFGHERGAFTDARQAREGLFEIASEGVIVLDEIAEAPLELQAKLLLVVETGRFRRVGGSRERRVRARVVAATNRDLEQAVAEGAFRRDLYYRLNAFTIRVPSLRERKEDILPIARSTLERLRKQTGRAGLTLSPAAEQALLAHDWPGNVRELVNALQRAAILAPNERIEPADLGFPAPTSPTIRHNAQDRDTPGKAAQPGTRTDGAAYGLSVDFDKGGASLEEVERSLIMQALEHTRGNISQAARLLGLSRGSFRYRIERAGLEPFLKEVSKR